MNTFTMLQKYYSQSHKQKKTLNSNTYELAELIKTD